MHEKIRSSRLTGSMSDGSIVDAVSKIFLHDGNFWTNAENIRYGDTRNSLLTRVGNHAGLIRVGNGTY